MGVGAVGSILIFLIGIRQWSIGVVQWEDALFAVMPFVAYLLFIVVYTVHGSRQPVPVPEPADPYPQAEKVVISGIRYTFLDQQIITRRTAMGSIVSFRTFLISIIVAYTALTVAFIIVVDQSTISLSFLLSMYLFTAFVLRRYYQREKMWKRHTDAYKSPEDTAKVVNTISKKGQEIQMRTLLRTHELTESVPVIINFTNESFSQLKVMTTKEYWQEVPTPRANRRFSSHAYLLLFPTAQGSYRYAQDSPNPPSLDASKHFLLATSVTEAEMLWLLNRILKWLDQ